jgi:hypothetical protein
LWNDTPNVDGRTGRSGHVGGASDAQPITDFGRIRLTDGSPTGHATRHVFIARAFGLFAITGLGHVAHAAGWPAEHGTIKHAVTSCAATSLDARVAEFAGIDEPVTTKNRNGCVSSFHTGVGWPRVVARGRVSSNDDPSWPSVGCRRIGGSAAEPTIWYGGSVTAFAGIAQDAGIRFIAQRGLCDVLSSAATSDKNERGTEQARAIARKKDQHREGNFHS